MMKSTKALLLFFTLLCLSKVYAQDEICDHDDYDHDVEDLDVEEDTSPMHDEGRRLAQDYPNMRIHVNTEFLRKKAPASYADYIENELAPPVAAYFESALRVKYPVVGKLKLGSSVKSICGYSTPSSLKNGVDADFVTILDSRSESGNVVATSKACYKASGTGRPLIATTNFNRPMLKEAKGNVLLHEKNMYLLIHEMMHTFGFSKSLYGSFIDSKGKTLKGHIKSVSIAGKTHNVINVAPLTERLRNFYGCSSIPGGIMENDGGSGTAYSHFERKFYVYETMASGGLYGRRVSDFSLALLEGSGWYSPNYDYAEPFYYGKGQGCSFVNDKCSSSKASFSEFCTGSSRSCAPQGRSGGKCSSDSKADGCKYVEPDVDYDCENEDGVDNARLPSIEVYGRSAGSRCFSGDLNSRKSSNGATSFCFKYNCVGQGSNAEVEILLGSKTVTCTKAGKVSVDGYYGGINCPDPLEFCGTVGKKYCPRGCMGRGECVNSKCVCRQGYKGIDCGLRA
jgi:hypothetical protein